MANVGFVSSRFSGNDGVSLESDKWAEVLEERGHRCFWLAGKLDKPDDCSIRVPEAFFDHPDIAWINARIWGRSERTRAVTRRIDEVTARIKRALHRFRRRFELDLLVVQNAMAIPMNVPLGVALTQFLGEVHMPAIAHHHDFYWERSRFFVNAVQDLLDMAFPPALTCIRHVTINSAARDELAWRKGLTSTLVPNVLDFGRPERYPCRPEAAVREHLGLEPDDIIVLQPTRVVPRKGIERAITIVSRLKNPKVKLVVTHESGDEGHDYVDALQDLAEDLNVDMRFAHTRIRGGLGGNGDGSGNGDGGLCSLWDVYPCAQLVTYASLYEGFGNAFLEAVFFRRPLVINRYSIWIKDIEPRGFRALTMDGFVTRDLMARVKHVLSHGNTRERMGETNYRLAQRHYSYDVLRRLLRGLVSSATGRDDA